MCDEWMCSGIGADGPPLRYTHIEKNDDITPFSLHKRATDSLPGERRATHRERKRLPRDECEHRGASIDRRRLNSTHRQWVSQGEKKRRPWDRYTHLWSKGSSDSSAAANRRRRRSLLNYCFLQSRRYDYYVCGLGCTCNRFCCSGKREEEGVEKREQDMDQWGERHFGIGIRSENHLLAAIIALNIHTDKTLCINVFTERYIFLGSSLFLCFSLSLTWTHVMLHHARRD